MMAQTRGIADFTFVPLCVILAAAALFFFWKDLNTSLLRLNEEPVGTVTYKHRAAQRRFVDRALWDRLKEASPVYSGDALRTASGSEATVVLYGGNEVIDMHENTLIYLTARREGAAVNLESGDLSVNAGNGSLVVTSGDTEAAAGRGTVLRVSTAPGAADFVVVEGRVELTGPGERRELSAGSVYSSGGAKVSVHEPRQQSKVLTGGEMGQLHFKWTALGITGPVVLDIARDRSFAQITDTLETAETEYTALLEQGSYFWRIYPAGEAGKPVKTGAVSGRVSVIDSRPPRLIGPAEGERFSYRTDRPGIRFQWEACEGAAAYIIEAAATPSMASIIFSKRVQPSGGSTVSIINTGFQQGTFYWRVTPVYPADVSGTGTASITASFRVEAAPVLSTPEPTERVKTVYLADTAPAQVLTWSREQDAAYYTFLLSRQEDLTSPLIEKQVRDNYYTLNFRDAGLEAGQYYWGVYQTDTEGNRSAVSRAQALVVVAGAPPPRGSRTAEQPTEGAGTTAAGQSAAALSGSAATGQAAAAGSTAVVSLAAPSLLRPAAGFVVNENVIVNDKQLTFAWTAVTGAESYSLVLTQGGQTLLRQTVNGTSFVLRDFSVLDVGTITWTVTAVPQTAGQKAESSSGRFSVNLGDIETAQGNESGFQFTTTE